jgi:hypothetical protein
VRIAVSRYEVTLDFAAGEIRKPVARVHVAHPFAPELLGQLREAHAAWQLERALALDDGTALHLEDGTWALRGRRRIRDGARVMMVIAPGLFRMDLRTLQDSYSVSLRNLSGIELGEQPYEPAARRVVEGPDGTAIHHNEIAFAWPGDEGARVRIVTRVPSYRGQLELDCTAAAFIDVPA